jgi:hypothetical protein
MLSRLSLVSLLWATIQPAPPNSRRGYTLKQLLRFQSGIDPDLKEALRRSFTSCSTWLILGWAGPMHRGHFNTRSSCGTGWANRPVQIGQASSPDGVNWTNHLSPLTRPSQW